MEAIRQAVAEQDVAGAFVRVRWNIAEEDRHEVDRAAIVRLLEDAADTKLEGRILPVLRSRAAGIAGLASLPEKIRAWAAATAVRSEPLLACLAALEQQSPDQLAAALLQENSARGCNQAGFLDGVDPAHDQETVEPHSLIGTCR